MSQREKLINRFLSIPSDFSYSDLAKLLAFFEYYEITKGKTGGSRRAFVNSRSNHIIRLHKPHPKPTLKKYQVKEIVFELKKEKLL